MIIIYYYIDDFCQASLATLGVPCMDVLRILVAVLLLGNVQFVDGEGVELDVKGNNGNSELMIELFSSVASSKYNLYFLLLS